MTVIDHEFDTIYTNDSIPINVGWTYRLMGRGDNFVKVESVVGKYVTVKGLDSTTLEQTLLKSAFDGAVKQVISEGP